MAQEEIGENFENDPSIELSLHPDRQVFPREPNYHASAHGTVCRHGIYS